MPSGPSTPQGAERYDTHDNCGDPEHLVAAKPLAEEEVCRDSGGGGTLGCEHGGDGEIVTRPEGVAHEAHDLRHAGAEHERERAPADPQLPADQQGRRYEKRAEQPCGQQRPDDRCLASRRVRWRRG